MQKRAIVAILLSITWIRPVHGQITLPVEPTVADTSLVKAWIDSSYSLSYSDPDHAITFANRALELSQKIDYRQGVASAHGELGYSKSVQGKFSESLNHFKKGIAINRRMNDSLGWVSQLNDLGTVYQNQSKYDQSLTYYFKALELCEEMGLERGVSATLGNIGLSYFEMKEHDQALKYYQRALEINIRLDNKASLAVNYNNIGLLYGDEGEFKKALAHHFKALEIRRELGYAREIANSLNNIGRVKMQQNQHGTALQYLTRALAVNQNKDPDLTSIIHENVAKVYLSTQQYDSALTHAQQMLALSRDYGSLLGEKVGYELLTKVYRQLGEYEKAYSSQQMLMTIKDSLLNKEKARQINELQTKYETARKEKEIALLQKEQEQQAMIRNIFLAGLILIGIIAVLIYNRQRLKIKKNRTELENTRLKEQKLEQDLAFKNKQLTTHTLHLVQKNEAMQELKDKISEIHQYEDKNINKALQKLRNLVDYSFNLDEDWEQFQLYFEEIHDGFFDTLKDQYPDLTPNELRLSALAKLNLSIKETATIMGITPASVKTARYRLRKKLGMQTEENLAEFMMDIEKEESEA